MCQGIFFECVFLVGTRFAEGIMACGHSRRFNRSNTWPHRPALYHLSRKLLPTGRRPHMALSWSVIRLVMSALTQDGSR
jgi:hypothetical protein